MRTQHVRRFRHESIALDKKNPMSRLQELSIRESFELSRKSPMRMCAYIYSACNSDEERRRHVLRGACQYFDIHTQTDTRVRDTNKDIMGNKSAADRARDTVFDLKLTSKSIGRQQKKACAKQKSALEKVKKVRTHAATEVAPCLASRSFLSFYNSIESQRYR